MIGLGGQREQAGPIIKIQDCGPILIQTFHGLSKNQKHRHTGHICKWYETLKFMENNKENHSQESIKSNPFSRPIQKGRKTRFKRMPCL